jgi:hypothetical protein
MKVFYNIRHPTMQKLVMVSKGMEVARMGESYLTNIMRHAMRGGTKYGPDILLRQMLMGTMAPNFLKE